MYYQFDSLFNFIYLITVTAPGDPSVTFLYTLCQLCPLLTELDVSGIRTVNVTVLQTLIDMKLVQVSIVEIVQ